MFSTKRIIRTFFIAAALGSIFTLSCFGASKDRIDITISESISIVSDANCEEITVTPINIKNNGEKSITVSDIALSTTGEWEAIDFDTDYSKLEIDSNKFSLLANDSYDLSSQCQMDLSLTKNEENSINFDAKLTPVSKGVEGLELGGLIFTIEIVEPPEDGEIYEDDEYIYCYNRSYDVGTASWIENGIASFPHQWSVRVKDKTKASYGKPKSVIKGEPVSGYSYTYAGCTKLVAMPELSENITFMDYTFSGCSKLETLSDIPDSVIWMNGCFENCTSITTPPSLGNSIISMDYAFKGCTGLTDLSTYKLPETLNLCIGIFSGCTNLVTAPVIPADVRNMSQAFLNCQNLTGTVEIKTTYFASSSTDCFKGTVKSISFKGPISNALVTVMTKVYKNLTYIS